MLHNAFTRPVCAALLFGLSLIVSVPLASAEPRVALVIGNADYGGDLGSLANPANDAALMQKSLEQAGFDVIEVTDADQKAMKKAISEFGKRLTAAGPDVTALFYYSGHGLQVGGENYLIPVKAEISAEADVDLEAISADAVLKQMQFADARVNIIILDACRNNPLPRGFRSAQMGLARIEAPRGSFVAYSTAPGDVARDGEGNNSPYTAALAKAITTPGISIEEAFRNVRGSVLTETGNAQTPWESSSLTAPFFFMPGAGNTQADATPTAPTADPSAAQAAREVELTFWNSVKDSKDPADYLAYIEQYPKGNFAKLAQNRLALLTGSVATKSANQVPVVPVEPTQEQVQAEASTTDASTEQVASAAADVPSDPVEAEKMCRDEKSDAQHRLGACQNALRKDGLDDVARGDLTNEVGRAYYDLRQLSEAAEKYRAAMALDPKEPVYPGNLGLALSDAGDYAGAIDAYGKAIEIDPKNVWHHYNRGNAYLNSGDPGKGGAELDAALLVDENFDLLVTRGYIALAEGKEKAAQEFVSRAIAYDGSNYSLLGIAVLYAGGRDQEAIDMADRQIAGDPGYGYGQLWKSMLLVRQGKSGQARTLLNSTVKDHPEDWPGMLMKWMLEKYDDATLLTKAREGTRTDINNQNCEAHFYMGARAFDQGDMAKAIEHFEKTLETKVYNYIEYYTAAALLQKAKGGN